MPKVVYFNIDEVGRDAVVAANLKKALQRHGVELEYGNRMRSALLKDNCPFDALIFHYIKRSMVDMTHACL
jgi:hypothetical protein